MAIFSRRSLQRLINENSQFLLPRQSKEIVRRLNLGEISTEWEVVLRNAFRKQGRVEYERDFGGKKRADIYFEAAGAGCLLADITAVSDKGLDALNPVEDLISELNKIARQNGINTSSLSLRVGDGGRRAYKGGPKAQLKLPGKGYFGAKIFGPDFQSFLSRIKQAPEVAQRFELKNNETDLSLDYLPKGLHLNASWLSYKVIYSLTDNHIYSALHNKAVQLQGTNFQGPMGIFLCDGRCGFLSSKSSGNLSYSPREVIFNFLAEHDFLSFVVTFVAQREHPGFPSPWEDNPYRVFSNLYKGHRYGDLRLDLEALLKDIRYPKCQQSPENALHHSKVYPDQGIHHGGTMSQNMQRTEVRISARDFFELLAGEITLDQFFARHNFLKDENPFAQALRSGRMMKAVRRIPDVHIEITPEDDDDWLVFTFEGPDPAISSFIPPRKKTD